MYDGRTPHRINVTPLRTRRFWPRINRPDGDDGCWEWTGPKDRKGYGVHGEDRAHRYSYTMLVGPIPEGLTLDHLCRVRHCCNPAHLEPVDIATNVKRGGNSLKTHCVNGHELAGDNVYMTPKGARHCRRCSVERSLAAYRARRAAGLSYEAARYRRVS